MIPSRIFLMPVSWSTSAAARTLREAPRRPLGAARVAVLVREAFESFAARTGATEATRMTAAIFRVKVWTVWGGLGASDRVGASRVFEWRAAIDRRHPSISPLDRGKRYRGDFVGPTHRSLGLTRIHLAYTIWADFF